MQCLILTSLILTYFQYRVIHQLHPSVINHAIDKVEDRADCFFILDGSSYGRTIQGAKDDIKAIDSNYVATYYPWD